MAEICSPSEFPALLRELDREFIFAKERRISLKQRFADVFDDPATRVLVRRDGDSIASTLTLRRFRFIVGNTPLPAAAIGLVWTNPKSRSKGHASSLLNDAVREAQQLGSTFVTLWSTRPGFYQPTGFVSSDSGKFGVIDPIVIPDPNRAAKVAETPVNEGTLASLEPLRRVCQPTRVERTPAAWQRLPPPAEKLSCLVARTDTNLIAYALVGLGPDGLYLYELCGDPDCYAALWNAMSDKGLRLFLNDRLASRSFLWFEQNVPSIRWQEQIQSMWLPLAPGQSIGADWHIPYFDRF